MYPALRIERTAAEEVRKKLLDAGAVDRERRFIRNGTWIEIPVKEEMAEYAGRYGDVVEQERPVFRERAPAPFKIIEKRLNLGERSALLPRKWEIFGDVLILRIPEALEGFKEDIARQYADVLGARTVLRDIGGIEGEYREPVVEFLIGESAETVHIENGIKFKFDASKLMFSSGNIDERVRMAYLPSHNEVLVDMFAGIGYFSIPAAVHSRPRRVYACEKNPVSFDYLEENIEINGVNDRVVPILGDCRERCPENAADRVIMGYLGTTHLFLPYAFETLKDEGTIHYHETCPLDLLPDRPLLRIKAAAKDAGYSVIGTNTRKVKSYAPGIAHVVVDARVKKAER